MTKILRATPGLTVAEVEAVRAVGGGVVAVTEQSVETTLRGGLRKRPGLTIKQVEAALRASSGIKTLAAEILDVRLSQISHFCRTHPRLEAVIEEVAETVIDLAEAKLMDKVAAGDLSAIRYFLDNRGGARGYGRKVQTDGTGTSVTIVGPDAEL